MVTAGQVPAKRIREAAAFVCVSATRARSEERRDSMAAKGDGPAFAPKRYFDPSTYEKRYDESEGWDNLPMTPDLALYLVGVWQDCVNHWVECGWPERPAWPTAKGKNLARLCDTSRTLELFAELHRIKVTPLTELRLRLEKFLSGGPGWDIWPGDLDRVLLVIEGIERRAEAEIVKGRALPVDRADVPLASRDWGDTVRKANQFAMENPDALRAAFHRAIQASMRDPPTPDELHWEPDWASAPVQSPGEIVGLAEERWIDSVLVLFHERLLLSRDDKRWVCARSTFEQANEQLSVVAEAYGIDSSPLLKLSEDYCPEPDASEHQWSVYHAAVMAAHSTVARIATKAKALLLQQGPREPKPPKRKGGGRPANPAIARRNREIRKMFQAGHSVDEVRQRFPKVSAVNARRIKSDAGLGARKRRTKRES